MIGQSFLPNPALREYVKSYQLWHFVFPDDTKLPYKPYAPRPENTIAFFPRGFELIEYVSSGKLIKLPASVLLGQYDERRNRHIGAPDTLIFLVNFQPGVLHRLTGIPFYELTNNIADAEAVFPKEIRKVNERLSSVNQYEEMVQIVETFLLGLVRSIKRQSFPIDTVAELLVKHPENSSVIRLARESFLSTRQFERRFKERIGVSPKLFARIARMNKAFRIKYNHPEEDWLRIALCCGYHDYQHLVRDFKYLADASPNAYLSEDDHAPERYFGLKDSSLQ